MPKQVNANGKCYLTGSEQIGTVIVNTTSNYQFVTLNPMLLATTWLQRQATLYNKFKFNRAVLRFSPFCPSTTFGRIMIAWSGDAGDNTPTSANQVSQYQGAREAPVWRDLSVAMPQSLKPEYTVSATPSTESQPGEFIVYADYGTTSLAAGALYLDYDISFWERASYAAND
jgi:hypothetical protein